MHPSDTVPGSSAPFAASEDVLDSIIVMTNMIYQTNTVSSHNKGGMGQQLITDDRSSKPAMGGGAKFLAMTPHGLFFVQHPALFSMIPLTSGYSP